MSSTPADVRLVKSHEWGRRDGAVVTVGVSEHAIEMLNREIVFVELPEPGRKVKQGDVFGVIEAVKAASDLYAPVSGVITEVNTQLVDNPMLTADSPFGDGWMIKIEPSDAAEFDGLMDAAAYDAFVTEEGAH